MKPNLQFDIYQSPLGEIYIVVDQEQLVFVDFNDNNERIQKLLKRRFGEYELTHCPGILDMQSRLDRYFEGDWSAFHGLDMSTGGTELIAAGIVDVSAGFSPVVVLTLLIIVTMTLSDVMNNTATAVIAAPIALEIAVRLDVNPDPFLMGVAVAASCAFLTPIGHKNNTLIMGPGGYRFGDYWRMGLPLEILIIAVSVPAITFFWPM